MAKTTPPIEIYRDFAKDYADRLVWIKDIKNFGLYDKEQGYYKIMQENELENIMNEYLYMKTSTSTSLGTIRSSYLSFLQFNAMKNVPSIVCPEAQYTDRYNYIAFNDKVMDLDDFSYHDHGHEKLVFHKIPFTTTELEAKPTRWLQFLDQCLVKQQNDDGSWTPDPELQSLLQEMFGYCLLNTIKAQKGFFIFGASRSGKGTIFKILYSMLGGSTFCSTDRLASLTDGKFAMTSLIGKKVNLAGEDESDRIEPDTFKSIVAGDPITAEYKFGARITFIPQAKLVISANKTLKFKYIDQAIEERLIPVPTYRSMKPEERDMNLDAKLHKELPGIVAWAIEGAKRLVANDFRFTKSSASQDAWHQIHTDVSNSIKFFNENFVVDTTRKMAISKSDIFQTYKTWCTINGYKNMSIENFWRELQNDTAIRSLGKLENCVYATLTVGSFVDTKMTTAKVFDEPNEFYRPTPVIEQTEISF